MLKNNAMFCILFIIIIAAVGCSSDNITGKAAAAEPSIYEDAAPAEQQAENQTIKEATEENLTGGQDIKIKTGEEFYNELVNDKPIKENPTIEEFDFSPDSIVSTQNKISLSIDSIKHEIKSEYWGKIVEITSTILNNGNKTFKPKLLVLLYDEKDFKEDWLKPKAEIGFDIAQLNPGEHATRDAIVSISFDDLYLTKNFKLILVDAADPANNPLVVVEKNFDALK